MKRHHLDCGTMCPAARRWVNGDGGLFERGSMVCHCVLLEGPDGLILVETGMGTQDAELKFDRAFEWLAGPVHDPAKTAVGHVRALGFRPEDVRHIVVTHLDLDHAGGLADFPHAQVHLHADELQAVEAPTRAEARRYVPRQWAHGPHWQPYSATEGERWFGFEAVRDLRGLPPEVLLIPLPGHTRGHTGVAIQTEAGWLLHGGDAWFSQQDLVDHRRTPVGLRWFQSTFAGDNTVRLANLARLQTLAAEHGEAVRMVSAHDPRDLAACRAG